MGRITELYGFIYSFNSFTKVLVGCYFCCWQVRIIYLLAKCRGGGSDKNTTSLLFLQERSSLNNPRKSLSLYDCSKILFSVNSSLFQSKSIAWDEAHVRTEMFLDLRKSGSNSGGVTHLLVGWCEQNTSHKRPEGTPQENEMSQMICQANVLSQYWSNHPHKISKLGNFDFLWGDWTNIWGMSGASSGACLGHHLGHVWGIIWGMSGACLGHVWGMSETAIDMP